MKWTITDIEKLYSNEELQKRYLKLFSISYFYDNAIIKKDFVIPEKVGDLIKLTTHGKILFDKLKSSQFKHLEDHKIIFAILLTFYYDELYIDIKNSDSAALLKLLSDQILNGEITYPWIYGKLLYDKYFEEL